MNVHSRKILDAATYAKFTSKIKFNGIVKQGFHLLSLTLLQWL